MTDRPPRWTEYMDLDDLLGRRDPRNPKQHADDDIGKSLGRFGYTEPVMLDERTGLLSAGHGRVENLDRRRTAGQTPPDGIVDAEGRWAVPVNRGWSSRSDEEAAAYLVTSNQLTMKGGWSPNPLASILQEIAASTSDGLEGTGFGSAELDRLLDEVAAGATEFDPFGEWADKRVVAPSRFVGRTDPDAIPDPPPPRATRGDVWLLGQHRLMCGDSTDAADVARLMAGEQATLMATDPPYLVDYDGSNHPQSTVNSAMTKDKQWDDYVDGTTGAQFFIDYLQVGLKHLIDRALVYQWHADLRRHLVVQAWETVGLLPHQTIIWAKSRPVLTRSDFMWQHEVCMYGWVKGRRPETERRPPANETTVWPLDKVNADNDIHPTEKPVELFARPIRWHTRQGEVCFEPFSGSGSQIIAAHGLGRRCFAMELVPQYVDVACRRWQEYTGVVPVLEATGEKHNFVARETSMVP